MKTLKNYKSFFKAALLGLAVTACKPDFEVETPQKGSADFTKYVAVGNSLTAGFMDGGLYREGQSFAYPKLLADQFALVGGGAFVQPYFTDAQLNGSGYVRLTGFTSAGLPITQPVATQIAVRGMGKDKKTPLYTKYTGAINNLGVPGIRLSQIKLAGYGFDNDKGFNPYFERMLPNTPTPAGGLKTYLEFVAESNPTFFTCWIGNNDVLGFATTGGLEPITDDNLFRANYTELIGVLTAKGAKGVVANIPDVTSIPYFSVYTVAALKAQAKGADVWIRGSDNKPRVATPEDLIALTTDSIGVPIGADPLGNPIAKGFHPFYPLENKEVLDKGEVAMAVAAVGRFNAIIKEVASSKGLPVVDANMFLNQVKTGQTIEGATLNASFIRGAMFSLDGVHPTPKGYAFIANEFLKTINTTYGSTLPLVDINRYRGVGF